MIAKVLGRLIWITVAYCLSCFAAGVVLVASVASAVDPSAVNSFEIISTGIFVSLFVAGLAFIPAVAAIVIAEIFRIQNWIFYTIVGALSAFIAIGGADLFDRSFDDADAKRSMFFLAPGLVAGLVYWAAAGRKAGNAFRAIPNTADE